MTILTITVLFALLVTAVALKRVPDGHVYSLHRGDHPLRLLQPGLHLIVPGLDRIAHRIDLSGQTLRFDEPAADAPALRGTVYWQVLEPERADAVMGEMEQLIRRGALDALHTEPATARSNRHDLGRRVKQQLNHSLRQRGMMVTRVDLEAS
ncbi:MAG: hypothetical protein ABIU96_09135 [Rhodanobacter sp.]